MSTKHRTNWQLWDGSQAHKTLGRRWLDLAKNKWPETIEVRNEDSAGLLPYRSVEEAMNGVGDDCLPGTNEVAQYRLVKVRKFRNVPREVGK